MRHIWLIDSVLIYRLVYNPRRHLMVSIQLDLHVSTGSNSETLHSCFAFHRSVLGTGWFNASFSRGLTTQTRAVVPPIGWRWPWHLPSYWPFSWSSWSGNSPVPSSVWLVREVLYNLDLSGTHIWILKCIRSLHFPSDQEDWCVLFSLSGFGI